MLRKEFLDYAEGDSSGHNVFWAEESQDRVHHVSPHEGMKVDALAAAGFGKEKSREFQDLYMEWLTQGKPKCLADQIHGKLLDACLYRATNFERREPFLRQDLASEALAHLIGYNGGILEHYDPKNSSEAKFLTLAFTWINNFMMTKKTRQENRLRRGKDFVVFSDFSPWDRAKNKDVDCDTFSFGDDDPEVIVSSSEGNDVMAEAIAGLEESERVFLQKYYMGDDVSFRSLEEEYGVSRNALCNLHKKIVKKLQRSLRGYTREDFDNQAMFLDCEM